MLRRVLLLGIFILLSCKNKYENSEKKENTLSNENISINKVCLEDELLNIIKKFSSEYPIKEIGDNNKYTKQSYYLSFFKIKRDTIFMIGRQPFLFDIFPDFAFENMVSDFYKPKGVGFFEYDKKTPIVLFDVETKIGNSYYDLSCINSEVPSIYKINDKRSHDYIIPPLWKFKIRNDKFIFISKTDSLLIK